MDKSQAPKIVYKPSSQARITKNQAQRYGERLAELSKGGDALGVTTKEVLEDAESPDSPLHDYFEWDDTEAAEQYRLAQARKLVRSIEITIVMPDEEIVPARAMLNIEAPVENSAYTRYVTITDIADNDDYVQQVSEKARKELESWRRRYNVYSHLTPQIQVVTDILEGWGAIAV